MNKYIFPHKSEEFAKRFRIMMAQKNMRLIDISEKTGYPVSTISTWRRGRLPKKTGAKERLAQAFGVSKDDLFGNMQPLVFANEAPAKARAESAQTLRAKMRSLLENSLSAVDDPEALQELFERLKLTLKVE